MILCDRERAIQRMSALAKEGKDFIFIINCKADGAYVEEYADINPHELLFVFPSLSNIPERESYSNEAVERYTEPLTGDDYEQRINLIKQRECEGDSYLANLTCKIPVHTNFSLHDIFMRSEALYCCWMKEKFVCSSPEIFVRINEEGLISSFPMKSTIDATRPGAEKELMENKKEAAEHTTIVDLIRNNLNIIAEQVQVKCYRYIDRLTTNKGEILQASSEIIGQLPTDYRESVGTLLFRLLPAGSITGVPKPRTMGIIGEAEGYKKDFYTGAMDCYSKEQIGSAVIIRFIDQDKDGQFHYKAGGGITAQGSNDGEYKEVMEEIYVPIC